MILRIWISTFLVLHSTFAQIPGMLNLRMMAALHAKFPPYNQAPAADLGFRARGAFLASHDPCGPYCDDS